VIHIDRGHEPAALSRAREARLAAARAALAAGESPTFKGYGVARKPLHEAQHGKCAYCEMQQQSTALPTEHFRPKAGVTGDPDHVTSPTGYWWLAWSWDNLLFACGTCNSPARKGNHFALEHGSVPLVAEQRPPGEERPMLIDPALEDPIRHIVFVREQPHRWVPKPRQGSVRGDYTIKKLGLDRPELLTLYRNHVEHRVQPRLDAVRLALGKAEPREITRAWYRCLKTLFCAQTPFHGLSYDVVDVSISAAARTHWSLSLPRPGVR
jgi:uncharacterized protein (TIGR02646 family)